MSRSEKFVACLLIAGALIATLLRTWQAPNDWAEAHWLLDYRFGFVKRGLPGQLLGWIASAAGGTVDAGVIAAIAYALCGIFTGLLLLLAIRIASRSSWSVESIAVGVAFLTSPFLVITGNVIGYYDHIFLPLCIASIWAVLRDRWWTASLLQVASIFVHEASLLVAYPIVVLAALLRAADRADAGTVRPLPLLPVALPAVAAVILATTVRSAPPGFDLDYIGHLRAHPFVEGNTANIAGAMLAGTVPDALKLMLPFLGANLSKASSFGLVAPTCAALLLFLLPRARLGLLSLEAVVTGAVVLMPQVMHVIAWDLERLWTYSILSLFLVLWIHVERREPGEPLPRGSFALPFLAVCCNLAMETPLMGFVGERPPRTVRAILLVAIAVGLLALAVSRSRTPLGSLLRWRGRSLRDLLRR